MVSVGGYVERRAAVADRVYIGAAKQQLFYGSQLAIKDSFGKGGVAELFAPIDVRPLIQQIAHDFEAPFTGGEIERQTTVAARVYVGAREMEQLHAMEISVYRSLGEVTLSLRFELWPAAHDRQRESERADKGNRPRNDQICSCSTH
jgi:hypothetical protein